MKPKKSNILTENVAWAIKTIKIDKSLNLGIKDIDLAIILGTNKDTLATYRNKKGLLKGIVIERLVSVYNFNPMWLLKGTGEPFPGAREKYPEVCGPEGVETLSSLDDTHGDYVFVPQVSDKIGAGGGFIPYSQVEMRIAFRREWIQKKGNPKNMSLIRVSGDSMEPTLMSGDLVMVDHSRNYIDPQGGIYAIALDNTIMVKRLQVMYPEKRVQIISDNNKYKSIDADIDQIEINGKIIWFGRELVGSD